VSDYQKGWEDAQLEIDNTIQSLTADNARLREACGNAANTIEALDEECHGCELQINKLRRLATPQEGKL